MSVDYIYWYCGGSLTVVIVGYLREDIMLSSEGSGGIMSPLFDVIMSDMLRANRCSLSPPRRQNLISILLEEGIRVGLLNVRIEPRNVAT